MTSLAAPSQPTSSMMSSSSSPPPPFQSRLGARGSDDIDDDKREPEFARVRRRKGRGGYDDDEDDGYKTDGRNSDSVMDAANMLEDEGFFDELDDEDYDEDDREDDESYDMFSNTVIPNPLLDSIDPDGAAERFPELAADPRFWLDMFLFIAFLNFISFIGPRNPFPEMIPAMYTAGLPPPGM